jgi:hypothetical protein
LLPYDKALTHKKYNNISDCEIETNSRNSRKYQYPSRVLVIVKLFHSFVSLLKRNFAIDSQAVDSIKPEDL